MALRRRHVVILRSRSRRRLQAHLHLLDFLRQLLVPLSTLVGHLSDDALMLLDLGLELRHEAFVVALELHEAPARGVNGDLEGRLDRSHGLAHVGVRRGEMAADLQHLGLLMPHQAREGVRDSLHFALRGVGSRCLLVGRIDQRRDNAVSFLRAHGHARSRWAQPRT